MITTLSLYPVQIRGNNLFYRGQTITEKVRNLYTAMGVPENFATQFAEKVDAVECHCDVVEVQTYGGSTPWGGDDPDAFALEAVYSETGTDITKAVLELWDESFVTDSIQ